MIDFLVATARPRGSRVLWVQLTDPVLVRANCESVISLLALTTWRDRFLSVTFNLSFFPALCSLACPPKSFGFCVMDHVLVEVASEDGQAHLLRLLTELDHLLLEHLFRVFEYVHAREYDLSGFVD